MSLTAGRWNGDDTVWDAFVDRHGWLYQSRSFGDLLADSMGQTIVRLAATDGEEIRGVLSLALLKSPLFGRMAVSLPVSDHSGIAAVDAAATHALVEAAAQLRAEENLRQVELRHLDPPPGLDLPARDHKVTLHLPLPADPAELLAGLKAKVRNLVRKGEKAGLTYRQGGPELLDVFYAIYTRNLRDLGTPCYPRSLFAGMLTRFPEQARIHVARHPENDLDVAVGFTLGHRQRQQIPFAASRREHRNISPNMFLYWKMFESSIEAGYREFDFGRSTVDAGTHRFKKQWGPVERPLAWHQILAPGVELSGPQQENPKFQRAASIWRKLPVPLATWLSPHLIRHLP